MSSLALMRWLEPSPRRYDAGMRLLTLGRVTRLHTSLAEAAAAPGRNVLELGCGTGALTQRPVERSVGAPGPSSPVIITGNYDLTVRRVLRGHDAWVVVAPSQGINVWCAAAGGHLSTHQVVTALKTCGIEQRVSHHRAILPQLAATGVMAREVSRRCGWHVRFGPVYAEDLPR